MSRHRDVRNIKSYDDDYSDEEDMSDYGVSPASPTQAQYLYQRNRRSRGNSFGTLLEREMAQQKEEKLAYECMEQVYAVLGEGNWDEEEVWEAVHHADFDAERAVAMLLERPGQGSKGEEGGDDLFQLEMEGQKVEQQKQPAPVLDKATTITITVPAASSPQPSSSLTKAVQELSLEEQRQGEAAESGSPSKKKTVQVPQRSVARKKEVLKMVEESKHVAGKKEHLNMVVIGHVDAGKSTIMGHLLYQLGAVSDRLMHRYERDSKNIGKSSFSFAWVLDEHEEERNRGVTMDVAVTNFETETKVITLLDAPGHRDFVPNMISGAAQADVAVLVVNAAGGEFEAGFDEDGQTKEHALLARSLGVTQLIVAVNQLDQVDWSQDRFNLIQERMSNFLKQAGYNLKNVNYVPISGLKGENLVKRSEPRLTAWYSGPTLVERIDSFRPAPRLIEKPFRLCITDIYKHIVLGTTVAGKIETGVLAVGDKLLLMPLNEVCTVKGINVHQNPVPFALAGANVDIGVQGLDATAFRIGNILCDPEHPVRVCTRFKAQIIVFPLDIPITRGYHVLLHSQSLHEPAFITKLLCVVDQNTGAVKKRRPRCLTEKMTALVEITTVSPICVELYRDFKQLGRMTLRVKGKTIAAGIITQVLKDNPK